MMWFLVFLLVLYIIIIGVMFIPAFNSWDKDSFWYEYEPSEKVAMIVFWPVTLTVLTYVGAMRLYRKATKTQD